MCFAPQPRALVRHLNFQKCPNLVRFVHFDFEMCFAPQLRSLFRHLNFKKCSELEVLLAFSLANVLRATTACNFSSLIWPAGSAPAASASLLFDPPEPQIIGKTQCFATFLSVSRLSYLFAHLHLLSSDSFSSTLLSSNLSLLSDPFHLCFSSVHIVGSLTSKLPSNNKNNEPSLDMYSMCISICIYIYNIGVCVCSHMQWINTYIWICIYIYYIICIYTYFYIYM